MSYSKKPEPFRTVMNITQMNGTTSKTITTAARRRVQEPTPETENGPESSTPPIGLIDLAIAKSNALRTGAKLVSLKGKDVDRGEPSSNGGSTALGRETIPSGQTHRGATTTQDIWKWTLTPDAVANCFVKDAFEMKECENPDMEFFWLGRVPCRYVRIVGMVVGVQVYEKKTVYTVDDGSGVIDCHHRHSAQQAQKNVSGSPKKSNNKAPCKPESKTMAPRTTTMPQPPKPVAHVGTSVRVVGRVMKRYDTRFLNMDEIECCRSSNDEPNHWLTVCDLHRSYYFNFGAGTFVIPPPKQVQAPPPLAPQPKFKITNVVKSTMTEPIPSPVPDPQTPSHSSVASSAHTTPISLASTVDGPQSPVRLRHPSRLHTRDLTANTFRIYLKHYMDNAPPEDTLGIVASTDDEGDGVYDSSRPGTPTKPRFLPPSVPSDLISRGQSGGASTADETPRPLKRWEDPAYSSRTPRAKPASSTFGGGGQSEDDEDTEAAIKGFTLSHLRRVPELHLLAYRVVKTEAKRRAKEERAKAKEESQNHDSKRTASAASTTTSSSAGNSKGPTRNKKETTTESLGPKMKRLFRFAIRQLFEEGSIAIWDGPARGLPPALPPHTHRANAIPSLLSAFVGASSTQRRLWKGGDVTEAESRVVSFVSGNVTTATTNTTATTTTSTSGREMKKKEELEDVGELSDPTPGEESYIPLTTSYLAKVVEGAIESIMSRPPPATTTNKIPMATTTTNNNLTAKLWNLPTRDDHSVGRGKHGPRAGPTPDEILGHLKRRDERWERVGEWAVKEALEWSKGKGRVWCVGNGRWELCG